MGTGIRPAMAQRWARLAVALLTAISAAAPLGAQPASAPAAPTKASSPRGIPATALQADGFVNRVWVVQAGAGGVPGAFYVFLANGVLVVSHDGARPAVGTWAEAAEGLVMTEAGVARQVDVLELGHDRFRIRINNPRSPMEVAFIAAVPSPKPEVAPAANAIAAPATAPTPAPTPRVNKGPLPSSYRCGAAVYGVAFESGKAYVTPPEGDQLVLDEVTVKDAPASRRTFSNGALTFVEDTSEPYTRVLFAKTGLRPRPCTSLR